MALLRVILIAEDVSDCPTYVKGEKTTIAYPHVVLEETDKVCISALHQCHPYLVPLSRGVAFATLEIGQEIGTLRCFCSKGSVTFDVIKQHRRLSITPEILKHLAELKLEFSQLRAMPVFAPLPETSLQKIIPLLQLRQVNTGTDVIQQGDVGKFLYVITKGEVLVLRRGGHIREEVLATLCEGECFGEMSLISGQPISATIRAKSPVTLLQISKEDFDQLLLESSTLSIYFTKLLTQRLHQAYKKTMEILDKGIQGSLRIFGIPEIVQTLALNGRSGLLVISDKESEAEIYFDKGAIHQASFNGLQGEQAFYELLTREKGQFQFRPAQTLAVTRQIHKDTMQLLMEGLRRLDEERYRLSTSEGTQ